jgi:hypothetical protein
VSYRNTPPFDEFIKEDSSAEHSQEERKTRDPLKKQTSSSSSSP